MSVTKAAIEFEPGTNLMTIKLWVKDEGSDNPHYLSLGEADTIVHVLTKALTDGRKVREALK